MTVLRDYIKPYYKEVILGPILKLVEACFELAVPLIIAHVVDTIIPSSNQGNLVAMILVLVSLALIGGSVALLAQYFSAVAAVGCAKELSEALYRKILSLPRASQDKLSSASLLARLSSDTLRIQTGINAFLRLFLRAPIVVLGSFILACTIDETVSLYFFIMILVLCVIVCVLFHVSNRHYRRLRQIADRLINRVREAFLGGRVIRSFGQENRENDLFFQENAHYKSEQIRANDWSSLLQPLTFFVVNVTLILIVWQGNTLIRIGNLSVGELVALTNYLSQILAELIKMILTIATMNQTFVSLQRIQTVFLQKSEEWYAPLEVKKIKDTQLVINVENMSFSYPNAGESSLANVTFQVKKGEWIGIIGGIGSGKSTLAHLLSRLYDVSAGQLDLFQDGVSPTNLAEWRAVCAVVPQKSQLFSGTIRSNLQIGGKEYTDGELKQALAIAQATNFLQEKDGLDTPVERQGSNFSGGQRQRLCLARALVQKSPILILDDATSALDSLTERRFFQALRKERSDTTVLMISHRVSSFAQVDKILVLEKGRQVGFDRHDELLVKCSVHRDIVASQTHLKETDDDI